MTACPKTVWLGPNGFARLGPFKNGLKLLSPRPLVYEWFQADPRATVFFDSAIYLYFSLQITFIKFKQLYLFSS